MKSENHKKKLTNWTSSKYKIDYQMHHLKLFPTGRISTQSLWGPVLRHYFVNKGPSSQGYGFSGDHVWTWELDYKESWAPKNWYFWTVVLEKTLESPLGCKEIQPVHHGGRSVLSVHWKDWCWNWNSSTLATWCKELTHWKRPWFWERLGAGGEGNDRGWDSWMASLTQWTWIWVDSGSWW